MRRILHSEVYTELKPLLTDYSKEEIAELPLLRDMPSYRATQIYKWLTAGTGFEEMSNLPIPLRERLSETYDDIGARIIKVAKSKDGTEKFLYELRDGALVEGVLMTYRYGRTLCVSTQAGCRMGCAFCASGRDGLRRNLSAGEIFSELLCANGRINDGRIGNVVLMGSGEPLDNYDNVTKFIRFMSESGLVGQRSVSLSTCGLTDGIRALADDGFSVTLCLSLHSPFDDRRVTVMPTARRYKVADIMDAARYYFSVSGRRIIVEYALMRGFNTRDADARELRRLTADFPCHINLIPLNDTDSGLSGVTAKEARAFLDKLTALGASATIRRSLGDDIEGACGQLKRRYLEHSLTEDKDNG